MTASGTGPSAFDLDRTALENLCADVRRISDADLAKPTPCAGWTVRDLLVHMNTEHAAFFGGTPGQAADPREAFAEAVDQWLRLFREAGRTIRVPKMAADVPTEMVLATHFVDMLVHRWDLAVARGSITGTPELLLRAAHPIAERLTAPDSPLVGVAYQPSLRPVSGESAEQALVRKLGRDPHWSAPASQQDLRKTGPFRVTLENDEFSGTETSQSHDTASGRPSPRRLRGSVR